MRREKTESISALNTGERCEIKTWAAGSLSVTVAGYKVMSIEDIKIAWIRTTTLDGTKSFLRTLSMSVTTDRMFVYEGGQLVVTTNGQISAPLDVWDCGSVGNACGLRNSNQVRQSFFPPHALDIFDLIIPENTRVELAAATWQYC